MKYYTNRLLILPLLGFLAAGCSTSSNLQTSEVDDVYFSTKDKVTYVEPALEATDQEESYASATQDDESRDVTERVSDPETYANSRRSSSNTPYQYSYYDAPFGNPFWAYQTPFYYPGRYYSRAVLVDPWLDPWYDPFYGPSMALYDPFWPRPGFSVGIGIGYGRFYNPWGYGYGYGYGYNPYRYGSYYDGYYGGGVVANRVAYGPRNDRSSNVAGRNPNISRESRGTIASPASNRSSNAVVESGTTSRSRVRSSASASESDGTVMPRRRQVLTTPQSQSNGEIINTPSRSSRATSTPSSSQSTQQPVRRQRSIEYTPAPIQSEPRNRSYDPAPSRSYEPSRSSGSSSSSSGSSSGGSSSGGSRRGRN